MALSSRAVEISSALASALAQDATPTRAVGHTSELEYVQRLPRRTWDENSPEVQALAAQMTAWLRSPIGAQALRPIQAIALSELYHWGGLFGPMRVGSGKTIVTFLAATVVGARRPILFIPAKLREKTQREFARLYRDWRGPVLPNGIRIVSYEELSRDYGDEEQRDARGNPLGLIELADPDLIICDEVHRLKTETAACTKKMSRFMRHHPDVRFIGLSGTITNKSLKDYAHILVWSLKERAPVPRSYNGLRDWCAALDVKVRDQDRLEVGALLELADPNDVVTLDPLTAARRGYRRRLTETPGVVAYAKEYDGAELFIREITDGMEVGGQGGKGGPPKKHFVYNANSEKAFVDLRKWIRPDESTIPDGMTAWRHARELALGFCYHWSPWPPAPWKNARAEWHRAVREVLSNNNKGLDSERQVALEVIGLPTRLASMRGETRERWTDIARRYAEWQAIKDSFEPNQVAVWLDYGPLEWVATWMQAHRGIVWAGHVEFGNRLAALTGASYFGPDGRDARGKFIEDAKSSEGSIIASVESNKEGRNLQIQWYENLITNPMTTGNDWEQTLGRTHREEQPSDEVNVDVIIGCKEQATAWLKAKAESRYIVDSSGLPAKILFCDQTMPDEAELERRTKLGSARWW